MSKSNEELVASMTTFKEKWLDPVVNEGPPDDPKYANLYELFKESQEQFIKDIEHIRNS